MKAWAHETVQNIYGTNLNEAQLDLLWSFIVSIFIVGGVIGSFMGSYVADKIGR